MLFKHFKLLLSILNLNETKESPSIAQKHSAHSISTNTTKKLVLIHKAMKTSNK